MLSRKVHIDSSRIVVLYTKDVGKRLELVSIELVVFDQEFDIINLSRRSEVVHA